jgi:hypothetical protein
MLDFQTKLNNTAGPAGHLTAEEFNNFIRELENVVRFGDLTLDSSLSDVTQLAQAVAIAGRSAGIFNDTGSANVIELLPHAGASTFPLPPDFTGLNGNAVSFRPAFANTGAATLNLGMTTSTMLGARGLVRPDGAPLSAGDIQPGGYVTAIYDAAIDRWRLAQVGFATDAELQSHIQNTNNPHSVTLGQLGGASAAALQAHVGNTNNPHNVTLGQLGGAPLNSPGFTGNPTAPTPASNDNDASVATTAFTQAAILAALQGAGLSGGFTQSFDTNGWCRMPNGLIVQWGRVVGGGGEGTGPNVTFPIAFPNNCVGVVATDWNRSASAQYIWIDCFVQIVSVAPTMFATFVQNPGSNQNNWDGFFWIAVGF